MSSELSLCGQPWVILDRKMYWICELRVPLSCFAPSTNWSSNWWPEKMFHEHNLYRTCTIKYINFWYDMFEIYHKRNHLVQKYIICHFFINVSWLFVFVILWYLDNMYSRIISYYSINKLKHLKNLDSWIVSAILTKTFHFDILT